MVVKYQQKKISKKTDTRTRFFVKKEIMKPTNEAMFVHAFFRRKESGCFRHYIEGTTTILIQYLD